LGEGEREVGEGVGVEGVVVVALGVGVVDAVVETEGLEGFGIGVDEPVVGDVVVGVELEFVDFVGGGAGGGEDFDAEVGGNGDAMAGDEVEAGFGDEDNVGAADVFVAENCVDVADESAEVVLFDVTIEEAAEFGVGVGVLEGGAGAHADFSVDEFEAHAGRVFAEHEEFLGGHFGLVECGH
jgi:hypothetical protein